MLRSAVDNPGQCVKGKQRKIVAVWITSYNEGDGHLIDPGAEDGS